MPNVPNAHTISDMHTLEMKYGDAANFKLNIDTENVEFTFRNNHFSTHIENLSDWMSQLSDFCKEIRIDTITINEIDLIQLELEQIRNRMLDIDVSLTKKTQQWCDK